MMISLAKLFVLVNAILLVTPLLASAQDDARVPQIEQVRTLVHRFGPKPTKLTLITRQLIVIRGKIIRSRETSFDLKHSGRVTTIFYENVLELGSEKGYISFVPNPKAKNHGQWEDVGRIYPGTKIFLVLFDGGQVKGFANSSSKTHLITVDENGRKRVDVPREKIAAAYGLVGGYGGVKAGASKGAEGMTNDRDVLLDGVFAGVGALVGLVKSDGRPILIYSR